MKNGRGDGKWGGDSDDRARNRSRSRSPIGRRGGGGAGGGRRSDRRDENNDRMVYISNIPYEMRWMEIKDLVREKAGEVVFVEILEDHNGRSKGAAVVEFRDKESVAKCVEALHRFPLKDRLVVAKEIRDPVAFFGKVREDTGIDFLKNGALGRGNRDGRGLPASNPMQIMGGYETYGLSPAFLGQLGIDGPLCNRVFVANVRRCFLLTLSLQLSYSVTSGKLHDIFSLAGKVTWVDVQMDKDGKSKGLAVVQFSHPIEAVQAISMLHHQHLYDRAITVKMDKFEKPNEMVPGELPAGLRSIGMGLGADGAPLADVEVVLNQAGFPGSQNAPRPIQPFASAPTQPVITGAGYGNAVTGGGYGTPTVNQGPTTYGNGPPSGYGAPTTGGYGYGGSVGGGYGAPDVGFSVSRSLLIKNLPVDYTWQIVRDRTRQFGEVDMAEMVAAGCAKVRFVQLADAERARLALNNTTVEGRLIVVDFYLE